MVTKKKVRGTARSCIQNIKSQSYFLDICPQPYKLCPKPPVSDDPGGGDKMWNTAIARTDMYRNVYIKTETNKLPIMNISLNPKPHLEKKRLPLVWAQPCQQCSMGNEEWVGVWPNDLSTTRLGPTTSTSPFAQLQLDRSPSFSHIQKEVARCVWTGGGGKETASQMVVVFLEHLTVYSPSGLVISFTW